MPNCPGTLPSTSARRRPARSRAPSRRARLDRRASGEMSGSMPLALEVPDPSAADPARRDSPSSSAAIVALVASISFFVVGPRFVPPVASDRSPSRRPRPALKILRLGPQLADDRRSRSTLPFDVDERAVRLIAERATAAMPVIGERVDEPEQHDRDDRVDAQRDECRERASALSVVAFSYVRCSAARISR